MLRERLGSERPLCHLYCTRESQQDLDIIDDQDKDNGFYLAMIEIVRIEIDRLSLDL